MILCGSGLIWMTFVLLFISGVGDMTYYKIVILMIAGFVAGPLVLYFGVNIDDDYLQLKINEKNAL